GLAHPCAKRVGDADVGAGPPSPFGLRRDSLRPHLFPCERGVRGSGLPAVAPVGGEAGGARGSRTPDLLNAIQALSQLRYGPSLARRWDGRVGIALAKSSRTCQPTSAYSGEVDTGSPTRICADA